MTVALSGGAPGNVFSVVARSIGCNGVPAAGNRVFTMDRAALAAPSQVRVRVERQGEGYVSEAVKEIPMFSRSAWGEAMLLIPAIQI